VTGAAWVGAVRGASWWPNGINFRTIFGWVAFHERSAIHEAKFPRKEGTPCVIILWLTIRIG
jgi:hypothetical protein